MPYCRLARTGQFSVTCSMHSVWDLPGGMELSHLLTGCITDSPKYADNKFIILPLQSPSIAAQHSATYRCINKKYRLEVIHQVCKQHAAYLQSSIILSSTIPQEIESVL